IEILYRDPAACASERLDSVVRNRDSHERATAILDHDAGARTASCRRNEIVFYGAVLKVRRAAIDPDTSPRSDRSISRNPAVGDYCTAVNDTKATTFRITQIGAATGDQDSIEDGRYSTNAHDGGIACSQWDYSS